MNNPLISCSDNVSILADLLLELKNSNNIYSKCTAQLELKGYKVHAQNKGLHIVGHHYIICDELTIDLWPTVVLELGYNIRGL